MAIDGTGKIYIPLEDFWGFVTDKLPQEDPFILTNPRFLDSSEITFDVVNEAAPKVPVSTIVLYSEDFWAFVEGYHAFAESHAEYCFGVPQFTQYDVELEYAMSSISHPLRWASPPVFMAAWKRLGAG